MHERASGQVERLAEVLAAGIAVGRKVVAASSCRRGDGCTTILLCAAQRLAQRGRKVVIVDADFDHPQLAGRLGLLPDTGWEEVLAGRQPLEEAVIESDQDRIAVLPLGAPQRSEDDRDPGTLDPAAAMDVLRRHYDLVLVDLGPFGEAPSEAGGRLKPIEPWLDAVVLVHDVTSTPRADLAAARSRVRQSGVFETGVVENFVPDEFSRPGSVQSAPTTRQA